MKNIYKIFALCMLLTFVALTLSACGRFSQPYPVEGSGYPHHYPKGQE